MSVQTIDRSLLGRVVSVANGKGGVGKTSIATELAGMSAAAGYKTLLIDLDPQGNAGEDLGYTGAGTGDDGQAMLQALVTGGKLAPSLSDVRPGLDVICGGERLEDLGGVLLSRYQRGKGVADLLAAALAEYLEDRDYDLVVIDCPPGEQNLQLLALGASRWLLVPTRGDAASLKGIVRIAHRLVEARVANPDLEVLGVVLFDIPSAATRIRREIAQDVSAALGGSAPLFDTTVRHSIAAIDARRRGLLVHEHAAQLDDAEPFWMALRNGRRPASVGTAPALAGDYAMLSHEILTRISSIEAETGVSV